MIGVVIPTYERPGRLRTCLEHLSLHDEISIVIVVDDGSTCSYPWDELKKIMPIDLVRLRENRGVGMARYIGAELLSTYTSCRYILQTDDDFIALRPFFQPLIEALYEPNVGMACGVSEFAHNLDYWSSDPIFPIPFTLENWLVPTYVWREVGNVDPDLRFWEDVDWCLRLRRHGFLGVGVNAARCKVEHRVEGGMSTLDRSDIKIQARKLLIRKWDGIVRVGDSDGIMINWDGI